MPAAARERRLLRCRRAAAGGFLTPAALGKGAPSGPVQIRSHSSLSSYSFGVTISAATAARRSGAVAVDLPFFTGDEEADDPYDQQVQPGAKPPPVRPRVQVIKGKRCRRRLLRFACQGPSF